MQTIEKKEKDLLSVGKWIGGKQCHGTHIEILGAKKPLLEKECDGLMTQTEGLGLSILHADCQAAIFFDPKQKVIANIHCGWRGSRDNFYKKTVSTFQKFFQTDPKDLRVCISPSLGPEFAEFRHYETELPKEFLPFQVKPGYFDFWAISRWQLQESGVVDAHIEIASMCTFSDKQNFFSYRREKITGRHATVVALKKPCDFSTEKVSEDKMDLIQR